MKTRTGREREIFRGRVFRLVLRDLRLPNGRRVRFSIVEHPGAVAIVPLLDSGEVILLRQYRPSIGRVIYEIPAGTLENGERPLQAARREIREETGYRARQWTRLGTFYTAPGFCTERLHVYLARDLVPAPAAGDPDEILRPVRVPLRRAIQMIRTGRIRDAKSIAGLFLCHERRPQGKK